MTFNTYKTLADLRHVFKGQKIYRNARRRIAIWEPTITAYVWYKYDKTQHVWTACGSTYHRGSDAKLLR